MIIIIADVFFFPLWPEGRRGTEVVLTFLCWRQSIILCRLSHGMFGTMWCSTVALVSAAGILTLLTASQSALILVVALSRTTGLLIAPYSNWDSPEMAWILEGGMASRDHYRMFVISCRWKLEKEVCIDCSLHGEEVGEMFILCDNGSSILWMA